MTVGRNVVTPWLKSRCPDEPHRRRFGGDVVTERAIDLEVDKPGQGHMGREVEICSHPCGPGWRWGNLDDAAGRNRDASAIEPTPSVRQHGDDPHRRWSLLDLAVFVTRHRAG